MTSVRVLSFFLLIMFIGCASSPARHPARSRAITVIGITDFHGALEPSIVTTKQGEKVAIGGASLLASFVRVIRDHSPHPTVVIDAGDMFQGSMISNMNEGKPVVEFYNALGVFAAAVGNHDFDFGPENNPGRPPLSIPKSPEDNPRGALMKRIKEARFPFLAANIIEKKTGKIPEGILPSYMEEIDGINIGVIGTATRNTPETTRIENVNDLEFQPLAPAVLRESKKLRAAGAHVVLWTTHSGVMGCHKEDDPEDFSGCQGELIETLKELPPGTIDFALGGHLHRGFAKYFKPHGPVPVMEPYSHGKYIAWAEIDIRDGKATGTMKGLIPVCSHFAMINEKQVCAPSVLESFEGRVIPNMLLGKPIEPDEETEKFIERSNAAFKSIKERKLFIELDGPMNRNFKNESALGNWLADLTRESYAEIAKSTPNMNHVIGMVNGGGLRANLPKGPLTYENLYNLIPFDNQIAVLTLSGEDLYKLVEFSIKSSEVILWSNLNYATKDCRINSILINGDPLKKEQTYTVVTTDFLATGGIGLNTLGWKEKMHFEITDIILRDGIESTLQRKAPLTVNTQRLARKRQKLSKNCAASNG